MSAAKFTCGPWFYQENADAYTHIVRPQANPGWIICSCTQSTAPECKANGRLIAAAPELLEVLQTIVRVADGRAIPGNLILDENSPLMDAARDAIRKATGEQQ